jgi:hypothetical protein
MAVSQVVSYGDSLSVYICIFSVNPVFVEGLKMRETKTAVTLLTPFSEKLSD